jgi:O-antigen/teichoic acid export membrane protein
MMAAGEIAARLVAFGATTLLARRLGPEGLGVLAFATAVAGYLIVFVGPGLAELGTREVARRPGEAATIAAGITGVRALLSAGLALALVGIAAILPEPPGVRLVVAVSAVTVVSAALEAGWVYKGLERGFLVGVALSAGQAAFALGILLWVHEPGDLPRVPLLQAAGEALVAGVLLLPLLARARWRRWWNAGREALRGGLRATLNRLLRAVILSSGVVVLGLVATDREVGLYSGAYRIAFLLTALAVAGHVAHLPSLVRGPADPATRRQRLTEALQLSWGTMAPLVIGGAVLGPDILQLLFGTPFRDGGTALRLLLVAIGALALRGPFRNVYIATDRLSAETPILGVGAAASLALNLWWIPVWGRDGAAAAALVTELILLAGAVHFVLKAGVPLPSVRLLRAPTVAAAVMGVLLVLLPAVHGWVLVAEIALGGMTYGAVLAFQGDHGLPWPRRTRAPTGS